MKDGGGIRYIDVENSAVVTFKEIRETAAHLYFDHDASQNSFMEYKINCVTELIAMSGQNLKTNIIFGNFWSERGYAYLKHFVYYDLNALMLKMMTKAYPK